MTDPHIIYIYKIVAISVLVVMAIMLMSFISGIRIPKSDSMRRLRTVRNTMVAAYGIFVLSAPVMLLESTFPTISNCFVYIINTIAHNLLLTTPLFLIITPESDRNHVNKFIVVQFIILILSTIYFLSVKSIGGNPVYTAICSGTLFIASCIALTIYYLKIYNANPHKDYFKWVTYGYFITLTMMIYEQGIVPLISESYIFRFRPVSFVYVGCNLYYLIRFWNYVTEERLSLMARGSSSNDEDGVSREALEKQTETLRFSIDQWVKDKKYLEPDTSVEDVACQLGTDIKFFRYYFRTQMPCDFRSWRISLRIAYAKELIKKDPDISMNRLSELSGFTSKSNFYSYFKSDTGMTPNEFKEAMLTRQP